MIKRLLLMMSVLIGVSVSVMAQEDSETDEQILHVGPYTQQCVGVAPQDCLVVRFEDEDSLSLFYDTIEGFTHEVGFEYTLRVNVTEVDDPPADASSLRYELVEIVQQFPAHITGKVWQLQMLYDTEVEEPDRYTLQFSQDEPDVYSAGLIADCNNVVVDVTLDPFNMQTTISTLALCAEDSLEPDYKAAIDAATLFSVENGELLLQTADGLLRFAPPAIDGTEWKLERVLGIAMMLELDDSVRYTIAFDGEQVAMTVACNQAGANVNFDGAVLTLTQIERTEALCEFDPIGDIFPPLDAVYYISPEGKLILEDMTGNLFEFGAVE